MAIPAVRFTDDLLELGPEHSRPGTPLQPQGLVLHSTADPGATARHIRDYFNRPKPPSQRASAHVVVDWSEILTLIPWQPGKAEVAWHAGPTANRRFLGMELCESADPNQAMAAYRNGIAAAAAILAAYGWPVRDRGTVWSHAEVSAAFGETDHTDPVGYLRGLGIAWDQVLQDIDTELKHLAEASGPFPDVPASRWSASAIVEAKRLGLVAGKGDGNFHPEDPLTREEAAVLAVRLYHLLSGKA